MESFQIPFIYPRTAAVPPKKQNQQQRNRKMKPVDIGKYGNPLLEHARNMNNPRVDKSVILTRVEKCQQDVPLSEVNHVYICSNFTVTDDTDEVFTTDMYEHKNNHNYKIF